MNQLNQSCVLSICLFAAAFLSGCSQPTPPVSQEAGNGASAADNTGVETDADPAKSGGRDKRFAAATRAKDALFEALSGRLMEVLQSEGPVAAINFCSQEASAIAATVSTEQGVEIGRTSFKLRNPNNAPREWVKPFVEQRVDTPQHVALENGKLGVVFPIHLNVKCLMCHGGPDEMLDNVKPELARLYPNDQATGFKQGDLRGWFWVEVPGV